MSEETAPRIFNQPQFLEICDSLFNQLHHNMKTRLGRCLTPALAIANNQPFLKEFSKSLPEIRLGEFFDQNFACNKYVAEVILLVLWAKSRGEEVLLDEIFGLWHSWLHEETAIVSAG